LLDVGVADIKDQPGVAGEAGRVLTEPLTIDARSGRPSATPDPRSIEVGQATGMLCK